MSVEGETLGGSHPFSHNGKDYKVSLINKRIKVAFERALFKKAREALKETRPDYDERAAEEAADLPEIKDKDKRDKAVAEVYAKHAAAYKARQDELEDQYTCGDYTFESAKGQKAIGSAPGMLLLISLTFGVDIEEAFNLLTTAGEEVQAMIKLIIRESFPGVKVEEDDEQEAAA